MLDIYRATLATEMDHLRAARPDESVVERDDGWEDDFGTEGASTKQKKE